MESLIMPVSTDPLHYDLFILLAPMTLERMATGDPFDRRIANLPGPYQYMRLRTICVCTPSLEDFQKILELSQKPDPVKAILEILYKGYKFDPREGDGSALTDLKKIPRGN